MASLREMDATCNVQCRQFTMQPRTCTYIHNYIHRLDFHGSCCVELVLNCNGRSSTRQVQWSFYKGDFLGAYVHSRTHEGMRGHGFAPAHQGLLLVGHPKTSRESYRNPYVCTIIIHCKYTQMTNLFCTPTQAKNWYTYIHRTFFMAPGQGAVSAN